MKFAMLSQAAKWAVRAQKYTSFSSTILLFLSTRAEKIFLLKLTKFWSVQNRTKNTRCNSLIGKRKKLLKNNSRIGLLFVLYFHFNNGFQLNNLAFHFSSVLSLLSNFNNKIRERILNKRDYRKKKETGKKSTVYTKLWIKIMGKFLDIRGRKISSHWYNGRIGHSCVISLGVLGYLNPLSLFLFRKVLFSV